MLSPNINSLKSIDALEDELKDFLSDPETTHNYEKSVTWAQTILKHKKNSSIARYTMVLNQIHYANKLAPLQNFDQSINELENIIKDDEGFIEAYLMLAKIYEKTDKQKEFDILKKANFKFPNNYLIMYDLANLKLYSSGEKHEAVDLFSKCVEKLPQIPNNWGSLGTAYIFTRELELAKTCFETALAIDPKHLPSMLGVGVYNYEKANFSRAKEFYTKSLELSSDSYYGKMNLAYLELLTGNFQKGLEMYEQRDVNFFLKKYGGAGFKPILKKNISKNLNQKIVILNEQGLGDDIMFARYLKPLSELGYDLTFMTQPELINFFKASPELKKFDIRNKLPECNPNTFDYRTFLCSIPYLISDYFNKQPLPYSIDWTKLATKKNTENGEIKKLLDNQMYKVGVSWSGNIKHHRHYNRSISLLNFSELFRLKNIQFYVVQKGLLEEERNYLEEFNNVTICDKYLDDFVDSGFFVSKMNYVVTVDTSLVHLSGTMGQKTGLLLPKVPDWRWRFEGKQDWYPSVELYRQEDIDDWKAPLEDIKTRIKSLSSSSG